MLPLEVLYQTARDHFVELLSADLMVVGAALADGRAAQSTYDELAEDPATMISQRAVLAAYTFLGESCLGGMPMTGICSACLFDPNDKRLDMTQCNFPTQKVDEEPTAEPYDVMRSQL